MTLPPRVRDEEVRASSSTTVAKLVSSLTVQEQVQDQA